MSSLEIRRSGAEPSSLRLPQEGARAKPLFLHSASAGGDASVPFELLAEAGDRWIAALVRSGRRWVVLVPLDREEITLNGIPIVGLKIFEHGDSLGVEGVDLRLVELVIEELAEGDPLIRQGKACPVCRRDFEAGHRVLYCPSCGLAHHHGTGEGHDDCWGFVGKCASSPYCGYEARPGEGSSP